MNKIQTYLNEHHERLKNLSLADFVKWVVEKGSQELEDQRLVYRLIVRMKAAEDRTQRNNIPNQ